MARKTYNEKLRHGGDLPKIEDLSYQPDAVRRWGGTRMLIAAPLQYNEVMANIPQGEVTTVDRIRARLAAQAGADFTCPLTAGIFTNVCARASVERDSEKIPYWRTLRAKGELNEKYPDGIESQKLLLQMEGHTIVQKGKRAFVEGYEGKLADLNTKQHSTNYTDTLIEVAEDCPVQAAEAPPSEEPKSAARLAYEMLIDSPYRHTSDDVIYATKGEPKGLSREAFFSKGQPCFRASPLAKRYGWGIHSDHAGRIALFAVESEAYRRLASQEGTRRLRALRQSKR